MSVSEDVGNLTDGAAKQAARLLLGGLRWRERRGIGGEVGRRSPLVPDARSWSAAWQRSWRGERCGGAPIVRDRAGLVPRVRRVCSGGRCRRSNHSQITALTEV